MREKIYAGLASVSFLLGLAFLGLDGNFAASRKHYDFFLNGWAYVTYAAFALAVVLGALTLTAWRADRGSKQAAPPTERPTRPRSEVERLASQPAVQLAAAEITRDISTEAATSQKHYDRTGRSIKKQQALVLRQQGMSLHDELWEHVRDSRRSGGYPWVPIPKVYIGQAKDWHARFVAFADPHLSKKEQAKLESFPSMLAMAASGFGGVDQIADSLDKMFTDNLAVLGRVESRL